MIMKDHSYEKSKGPSAFNRSLLSFKINELGNKLTKSAEKSGEIADRQRSASIETPKTFT